MSGGTSVIHGPGSSWEVPKGMEADLYNNGTEPHVHRVWNLVHSKM